ncbi:acetyl-CoA carboxylase biotin carboxylase subunit [bacterium 210820-DFI.6.52]|uniref:Biotin carboxylase n=1 Tax=Bittarella massiliensis (ex Durand et al. 2017) TaxID=1720313 RepID=A0AAQ1ME72_9FIRM|nr:MULTISPECIES: acetyl-CoA carboxylase biotin carboxylase subunit [Eubacteriales]MCB5940099.1 acetyl-CoA carboxylase biotin carboxylase subunit [bacterium 210820-DFI.6.52]ERI99445.1 acetyl-CoA carboxylase, biotin carboxylase subunit [Clostridium sp. ATCC 29733]MZL70750.1 acetyl-CoA carboxylase biotin carboxylase subunit [Bittarella massiliensis (ex Durand et al. 2017)]MZL81581.1 acetyl-CoA carboxylase biotin carboxylase subunit [Bittarella massiliensis (ex Durand et al. 2017)]SHG29715.1 acety
MFSKILIANRGEIAVRIIRACRDMGITSVAVYSTADREALHTQLADEAICIGGPLAKDSYLNIRNLLGAAEASGAEAIHPGFGFLSENPDFAKACEDCGIAFIGPSSKTISLLGDKVAARQTAREAGVPVTPGSDGAVGEYREVERIAREIGFPVMLKAASGGGGKGIRKVDGPEELKNAFMEAAAEAAASFGDGRVYIEKFVADPRHIEFQVLADALGNTVHLFERECSIQRRHQKLVEEAPSSLLTPEKRAEMGAAAVAVAKQAGYRGAGTVEFLVDGQGDYYFCEMNARIQVEHPVTELVCSLDLIEQQIRIAAGEALGFAQEDLALHGHAIECRINAEDPYHNFAPRPGTVEGLHVPGGPGVRVDSAIYQGYTIPPYYDSMLSKLIVWGESREQALARMKRALAEYLFDGVITNIDLSMAIISSEAFATGNFDTNFLEKSDLLAQFSRQGEGE